MHLIYYISMFLRDLKTNVSAPLFYLLRSSDYYTHVEGSLSAKLCLVMLLNGEKVRNLNDSTRNTLKW